MYFSVKVAGNPVPQKRHRMSRRRVYDPSKKDKVEFLRKFTEALRKQNAAYEKPDQKHALKMNLDFVFSRPKCHFGSGKNENVLKDTAPPCVAMLNTPDTDNLAKFVLDALNETAYFDDRQIVQLNIQKRFAEHKEEGCTNVSMEKAEQVAVL